MVAVARNAMATRFEVVLRGENPVRLRAAAEEALDEIERVESQLSIYRPGSEASRLNARAAAAPVRVDAGLFRLLQLSKRLSEETGGAFDITVAPLVRCWGFMGETRRVPSGESIEEARSKVGMQWVELDEEEFTVRFARPGVMMDFGAIGKGYALDRAAEILREAGIQSGFIHGGTSSAIAIGPGPEGSAWNVAIPRPEGEGGDAKPLAVVPLLDESLSVSAVWGKSFSAKGRTYGHVIDPRSGYPVETTLLAAVAAPSATETDALSTALLIAGTSLEPRLRATRPRSRCWVIPKSA